MAGYLHADAHLRLLPGQRPAACARMCVWGSRGDVPSPQYNPPMCRSKAHGSGRRCQAVGATKPLPRPTETAGSPARLARSRRPPEGTRTDRVRGRHPAAPPSVLKEFMEGLGIDPEILGKTPMPSTHANPPSAKLLIAQVKAERDKLTAPKITPAQAALDAAEANVAAVDHEPTRHEKRSTATAPGFVKRTKRWKRGQAPPKPSLNSRSCSTRPRPHTSMPSAARAKRATTLSPRSSACVTIWAATTNETPITRA